ncbi:MAG: hypothetical protein AAF664_03590 [Planctomycetota bacterium]
MHTLIFPYYCDAEVKRYKRILACMKDLGDPACEFEFMLAASWQRSPDDSLLEAANAVGPARHFHCPTRIAGYPEGPNAAFWDSMLEVAQDSREGFALWFESDMCPIKPGWLDELDRQWNWVNRKTASNVLCMGLRVPPLKIPLQRSRQWYAFYKRFRPHKFLDISPHINGGACYRKNFAQQVGACYRSDPFDTEIGEQLIERGGFASTPALTFSTNWHLGFDKLNPDRFVVHGFNTNKDEFIDACIHHAMEHSIAPNNEEYPFSYDTGDIVARAAFIDGDVIRRVRNGINGGCFEVQIFGPNHECRHRISASDLRSRTDHPIENNNSFCLHAA